jgi:hypothetical protein
VGVRGEGCQFLFADKILINSKYYSQGFGSTDGSRKSVLINVTNTSVGVS